MAAKSEAFRFHFIQDTRPTRMSALCTALQEMGTADPKDISDVNVSSLVEYDGLVVRQPATNVFSLLSQHCN